MWLLVNKDINQNLRFRKSMSKDQDGVWFSSFGLYDAASIAVQANPLDPIWWSIYLGPVITDEMESKLITHCFSLITVGLITIVSYHHPLNDPREEGRSIMLRAFGLEWVQIPPLAFLRSLLQFTYMIPCSLLVNAQEPSILVIICIWPLDSSQYIIYVIPDWYVIIGFFF